MKKIIIDDKVVFEHDRPKRSRASHGYSENQERHPRFHEESSRRHDRKHYPKIVETKLFTNRDELVKYVNEKGKSDALIDIYKIEDELYKLVIKR
ncbi:MAG: hypothetical protein KAJ22_00355 [Candidatus Izimaplasma sp.]|nr:hypothetical protein [Candidatus Izimaplasma bacterium]